MAVKLSDLPPHVRKQVEAKTGTGKRSKPNRSVTSNHSPGSCHACDWTGTDRHSDPRDCSKRKPCDCFLAHVLESGHHRFDYDLEAS